MTTRPPADRPNRLRPSVERLEVRAVPALTFGPPTNYGDLAAAAQVLAADFDADGDIDLIAQDGDALALLAGRGDGTFLPEVAIDAGGLAIGSVVAVDLDGDGIPDLAVGGTQGLAAGALNPVEGVLMVLPGLGDGTFGAPLRTAVGAGPFAFTVGDFDGDGVPDLAEASIDGGGASILPGLGDGTFGVPRPFAAGDRPVSIAAADFNYDGMLDLVAANPPSGSPRFGSIVVNILLGRGGGDFAAPASMFPQGGNVSFGTEDRGGDFAAPAPIDREADADKVVAVVAADLDGDSRPDLALALRGGLVHVLNGYGNGFFGPRSHFEIGREPIGLAVADVNGDGRSDLIATVDDGGDGGGMVIVLNALRIGHGEFLFGAPSRYPTGGRPRSVAVADLDDDGRPDLATADAGSGSVAVRIASTDSAGFFQFDPTPIVALESSGTALVTVRRTGGSRGTATVRYQVSRNDPNFHDDPHAVAGTLTFGPGERSRTIAFDLTDDGTAGGPRFIQFFLSDPSGDSSLGPWKSADLWVIDDVAIDDAAAATPPPASGDPPMSQPPSPGELPSVNPPPIVAAVPALAASSGDLPPIVSPPAAVDGTPPRIVAIRRSMVANDRGRRRWKIPALVLVFNKPLTPPTDGPYRLTTAGRDRRFATRDDKVVPLRVLSHDPSMSTVNLVASKPFRRRGPFRLVIEGDARADLALSVPYGARGWSFRWP